MSDFNNCWIFSTDLWKMFQITFIKIHSVAEKLFHADTQTGGQTDKHNNAYITFSKVILHCNETWNFSRDSRNFNKQFCMSCFVRRNKEREMDVIMNWISRFWFAITNALHIYRRPAKFLAFLQTVEQILHYCLSGQHS